MGSVLCFSSKLSFTSPEGKRQQLVEFVRTEGYEELVPIYKVG
ncbi:hypothetical protein J2T14_002393 [Paenibacillus harenae]|nr:hypothetical protein [Paenibacillus harenae]